MTESTALTKAASKELADVYADLGIEEMAGMSNEDMSSSDDYAMPFLSLLQSGSPQCKKSDPRRVEGAEEGMFFNTVEKAVYSEVTLIPVAYRRSFVEWKLREDGGGFVTEYLPGEQPPTVLDDKNRDILENGHELKDTRYWYVLIKNENGSVDPAVIGMTRTQIKPSKAWSYLLAKDVWPDGQERGKAPPFFCWSYKATTVPQQNDEYSFWNWDITRGDPVTDRNIFEAAKALREAVKSGAVREATETLDESSVVNTSDDFDDDNVAASY